MRIFLGASKVIVGDLIRDALCVLDTKLTGLEMSFINLVSTMFRYYCYKEVNGLTRQYYPSSKKLNMMTVTVQVIFHSMRF